MKARSNKDGSWEIEMNGGTYKFHLTEDGLNWTRTDAAAKSRIAHGAEGSSSFQEIVDKHEHQLQLL